MARCPGANVRCHRGPLASHWPGHWCHDAWNVGESLDLMNVGITKAAGCHVLSDNLATDDKNSA